MADKDDKDGKEPGADGVAPTRASRRERARAVRAAPTRSQTGRQGAGRAGPGRFLAECREELKRVQWPSRDALAQATAIVIVVSVVIGVYLYALDQVFSQAAGWLIRQQAD